MAWSASAATRLRLVTHLGLYAAVLALSLVCWVLVEAVTQTHYLPRGWASLAVVVLFMGSVQLISLGIIGEYIRLIFVEAKRRPTYIVGEYRSTRDRVRRCGAPHRWARHRGPPRDVIATWSEGIADDNMAEEILVELAALSTVTPGGGRGRPDAGTPRRWVSDRRRGCSTLGCGWGITLEALEGRNFRPSAWTSRARPWSGSIDRAGSWSRPT